MTTVNEQVIAQNKVQIDNFLSAFSVAAAGAERLIELQTQAAKATFSEAAQHVRALSETKDLQGFSDLNARITQPSTEKLAAYSRNLYEIVSETADNFSKLVETQVSEFNKNFVSILDQASKNAPAGSESAIAAFKSTIAVANQAYDAMSKSAKRLTESAEAAVNSTASRKKTA
ncbi:MAG: phasin family protein [Burkholderiales bacterium]